MADQRKQKVKAGKDKLAQFQKKRKLNDDNLGLLCASASDSNKGTESFDWLKYQLQENSQRVAELEECLVKKQIAIDKSPQDNETRRTATSDVPGATDSNSNNVVSIGEQKISVEQSISTSPVTMASGAENLEYSVSNVQDLVHDVEWLKVQLQQAISTLHKQNEKQKDTVISLQHAHIEVEILQQIIVQKDELVTKLASKISEISSEYSLLKQNFVDVVKSKDNVEDCMLIVKDQAECKFLAEIEQLKLQKDADIQSLTNEFEKKNADFYANQERKFAELGDINTKFRSVKEQEYRELSVENDSLKTNCDALTKGVEYVKIEHEKTHKELANLSSEFIALRKEYDILLEIKCHCENQVELLKEKIKKFESDKQEMAEKIIKVESLKQNFEAELTEAYNQLNLLKHEKQSLENDNTLLAEEVNKLKSDNSFYKLQMSYFESKSAENRDLLEETHSLRAQNDELFNRINNHKDTVAIVKNELEALAVENAKLSDQVKEMSGENEHYKNEANELIIEKENLLEEITNLRYNLHAIEEENAIFKVRNTNLTEEIQHLKLQLSKNQPKMKYIPVTELMNAECNTAVSEALFEFKDTLDPEATLNLTNILKGPPVIIDLGVSSSSPGTNITDNNCNLSSDVKCLADEPDTICVTSKDIISTGIKNNHKDDAMVNELQQEIQQLTAKHLEMSVETITSHGLEAFLCKQHNQSDGILTFSTVTSCDVPISTNESAALNENMMNCQIPNIEVFELKEEIKNIQMQCDNLSKLLNDKSNECDFLKNEIKTWRQLQLENTVNKNHEASNSIQLKVLDSSELPKVLEYSNGKPMDDLEKIRDDSFASSGLLDTDLNLHALSRDALFMFEGSCGNCDADNEKIVSRDEINAREGDAGGNNDATLTECFQELNETVNEPEFVTYSTKESNDLLKLIGESRKELYELKTESDKVKELNKKLIKDNENQVVVISQLQESLLEADSLLGNSDRITQELQYENEKLHRELCEFGKIVEQSKKELLEAAESKCDIECQKQHFEEQLLLVKERLEYLESADNDILEINDMVQKLQEENENVLKENEELQCSFSAQVENNSILLTTIEMLKNEEAVTATSLKSKIQVLQDELDHCACMKKELEQKYLQSLKKSSEDENRFMAEVDGLLEENSTLKTNIQIKEAEIDNLKVENGEQATNSHMLSMDNAELQIKLKEHESTVSKFIEMQEKLKCITEDNHILVNKCDEFKQIMYDINKEKTDLLTCNEQIKELNEKLKESANLIAKHESKLSDLDQENYTLKTKVASLQVNQTEIDNESKTGTTENYIDNAAVREILLENELLKEENNEYHKKVSELEHDLLTMLEQVQVYDDTLTEKIDTASHLESEVIHLLEENELFKQRYTNAEHDLHTMKENETYLKEQIQIYESSVDSASNKSELQRILSQLELETKYKLRFQKELEKIHLEVNQLKDEKKAVEDEMATIIKESSIITKENISKEQEFKQFVIQYEKVLGQNKDLQIARTHFSGMVRELEKKNEELNVEIESLQRHLHAVSENRNHIRNQVEVLAAEVLMLQDAHEELLSLKNWKVAYEKYIKYDNEQMHKKLNELEQENKAISSNNNVLKQENLELTCSVDSFKDRINEMDRILQMSGSDENSETETFSKRIDVLHARISDMQLEKQELERISNELTSLLHDMQTKYEEVKSEMETTKKKCNKEISQLQKQLQEMNIDVGELRNMLDYMESEMYSTTEEKFILKENLEQQKAQFAEIVEQKQKLEEILSSKQQKDLQNMRRVSKLQENANSLENSQNVQFRMPDNDSVTETDLIAFAGVNNSPELEMESELFSHNEFQSNETVTSALDIGMQDELEISVLGTSTDATECAEVLPSFQSVFQMLELRSHDQERFVSKAVQTNISVNDLENLASHVDDNGFNNENTKEVCMTFAEVQTDYDYKDMKKIVVPYSTHGLSFAEIQHVDILDPSCLEDNHTLHVEQMSDLLVNDQNLAMSDITITVLEKDSCSVLKETKNCIYCQAIITETEDKSCQCEYEQVLMQSYNVFSQPMGVENYCKDVHCQTQTVDFTDIGCQVVSQLSDVSLQTEVESIAVACQCTTIDLDHELLNCEAEYDNSEEYDEDDNIKGLAEDDYNKGNAADEDDNCKEYAECKNDSSKGNAAGEMDNCKGVAADKVEDCEKHAANQDADFKAYAADDNGNSLWTDLTNAELSVIPSKIVLHSAGFNIESQISNIQEDVPVYQNACSLHFIDESKVTNEQSNTTLECSKKCEDLHDQFVKDMKDIESQTEFTNNEIYDNEIIEKLKEMEAIFEEKSRNMEKAVEEMVTKKLNFREKCVKLLEENYEKKVKQLEYDLEEKYEQLFRKREVEIVFQTESDKKLHAAKIEQSAQRKIDKIKFEKDQQFVETLRQVKADLLRKNKRELQVVKGGVSYDSQEMQATPDGDANQRDCGEADDQMAKLKLENQELASARDILLQKIHIDQQEQEVLHQDLLSILVRQSNVCNTKEPVSEQLPLIFNWESSTVNCSETVSSALDANACVDLDTACLCSNSECLEMQMKYKKLIESVLHFLKIKTSHDIGEVGTNISEKCMQIESNNKDRFVENNEDDSQMLQRLTSIHLEHFVRISRNEFSPDTYSDHFVQEADDVDFPPNNINQSSNVSVTNSDVIDLLVSESNGNDLDNVEGHFSENEIEENEDEQDDKLKTMQNHGNFLSSNNDSQYSLDHVSFNKSQTVAKEIDDGHFSEEEDNSIEVSNRKRHISDTDLHVGGENLCQVKTSQSENLEGHFVRDKVELSSVIEQKLKSFDNDFVEFRNLTDDVYDGFNTETVLKPSYQSEDNIVLSCDDAAHQSTFIEDPPGLEDTLLVGGIKKSPGEEYRDFFIEKSDTPMSFSFETLTLDGDINSKDCVKPRNDPDNVITENLNSCDILETMPQDILNLSYVNDHLKETTVSSLLHTSDSKRINDMFVEDNQSLDAILYFNASASGRDFADDKKYMPFGDQQQEFDTGANIHDNAVFNIFDSVDHGRGPSRIEEFDIDKNNDYSETRKLQCTAEELIETKVSQDFDVHNKTSDCIKLKIHLENVVAENFILKDHIKHLEIENKKLSEFQNAFSLSKLQESNLLLQTTDASDMNDNASLLLSDKHLQNRTVEILEDLHTIETENILSNNAFIKQDQKPDNVTLETIHTLNQNVELEAEIESVTMCTIESETGDELQEADYSFKEKLMDIETVDNCMPIVSQINKLAEENHGLKCDLEENGREMCHDRDHLTSAIIPQTDMHSCENIIYKLDDDNEDVNEKLEMQLKELELRCNQSDLKKEMNLILDIREGIEILKRNLNKCTEEIECLILKKDLLQDELTDTQKRYQLIQNSGQSRDDQLKKFTLENELLLQQVKDNMATICSLESYILKVNRQIGEKSKVSEAIRSGIQQVNLIINDKINPEKVQMVGNLIERKECSIGELSDQIESLQQNQTKTSNILSNVCAESVITEMHNIVDTKMDCQHCLNHETSQELDQLKHENQTLKQQILLSLDESYHLKKELEKILAENYSLHNKLDNLDSRSDRDTDVHILEDMKDAIKTLQDEKHVLEQQKIKITNDLNEENINLRGEIENLGIEIDRMKKTFKVQEEHLKNDNAGLLKMYNDLKNEIEVLMISKHDLEIELNAFKDLLDNHESFSSIQNTDHDSSRELTLQDLEEMEDLKASIKKLKLDLKEKDSYVRKLEEHLVNTGKGIPSLTLIPKPLQVKNMPQLSKYYTRKGSYSYKAGNSAFSHERSKSFDGVAEHKIQERSPTVDRYNYMEEFADSAMLLQMEKNIDATARFHDTCARPFSSLSNFDGRTERVRSDLGVNEDGNLALELKQFELVAEITKLRRDFRETKALYANETALLSEALENEKNAYELREKSYPGIMSQDVLKMRKELSVVKEENKILKIENERWLQRLKEQEEIILHLNKKLNRNTCEHQEVDELFGYQLTLLQQQRQELIDKLKDMEHKNNLLSASFNERSISEELLKQEKELLVTKLKQKEELEYKLSEKKLLLETLAMKQREMEEIIYHKDMNEIELMKQKRLLEEELKEIESKFRDREEYLDYEKNKLLVELREKPFQTSKTRLPKTGENMPVVGLDSSLFSGRNIGRLEILREEVEKQHWQAIDILRDQLRATQYTKQELAQGKNVDGRTHKA